MLRLNRLPARFRHALACCGVLAALMVRVVYVPYHLAVEEHLEGHQHAEALDPHHHHHHGHGHDHAHGDDEGPATPADEHPPHSESEHDTELLQARTHGAKLPPPATQAEHESASWRVVLRVVAVIQLERGPPPPRLWMGPAHAGRAPPRAV